MKTRIACPACGASAAVSDRKIGRRLRCPKCGRAFTATPEVIPVAKAAEEADHYTEIESPESPDSEPPKAKLPNPVWVVIGAGVLIFTIVGMMKSLNNLLRDINHLDAIVILLAVIAGVLFSINKSLANSKDRNDKSPPAD